MKKKGNYGNRKGAVLSEETKRRISEAKKGQTSPRKGVKLSQETKDRISKSKKGQLKGDKHPMWKDGRSYFRGEGWRELRQKVWERDDYTCQECGKKKCLLIAHHIKPYNKKDKNTNNMKNLISLCFSCHTRIHWKERRNA
jgi:5-methylcytosine-specific restriction endonuclease McrA